MGVPEELSLHRMIDWEYGSDGDARLLRLLEAGADVEARDPTSLETPLHAAARRRRRRAVEILLDHGAQIDARTKGGKTAYAHAVRRGFTEVAALLAARGAGVELAPADELAVAALAGRLDEARRILRAHPDAVRTGNPEEDRLLADAAGRDAAPVLAFLISAGADLTATGLDSGTPLHQAAWFGQPENARLLIEAGAPLDVFDPIHHSSPIGWAAHGSRYSGGAVERQDGYVELACLLLEAGCSLRYPDDDGDDDYLRRLRTDASPRVRELLPTPGAEGR